MGCEWNTCLDSGWTSFNVSPSNINLKSSPWKKGIFLSFKIISNEARHLTKIYRRKKWPRPVSAHFHLYSTKQKQKNYLIAVEMSFLMVVCLSKELYTYICPRFVGFVQIIALKCKRRDAVVDCVSNYFWSHQVFLDLHPTHWMHWKRYDLLWNGKLVVIDIIIIKIFWMRSKSAKVICSSVNLHSECETKLYS